MAPVPCFQAMEDKAGRGYMYKVTQLIEYGSYRTHLQQSFILICLCALLNVIILLTNVTPANTEQPAIEHYSP